MVRAILPLELKLAHRVALAVHGSFCDKRLIVCSHYSPLTLVDAVQRAKALLLALDVCTHEDIATGAGELSRSVPLTLTPAAFIHIPIGILQPASTQQQEHSSMQEDAVSQACFNSFSP